MFRRITAKEAENIQRKTSAVGMWNAKYYVTDDNDSCIWLCDTVAELNYFLNKNKQG